MASIGDRYVLGSGRTDHDRLRVISDIHDVRTRELLKRAGLTGGQRFMEFGCGLGYVTRWAATLGVEAGGIDLNPEQVAVAQALARQAGQSKTTFRVADVYDPGIEAGSVDLVYCRWLLVHLQRPVDALRVAYAALKPGGVMVCEESEVSGVYAEPRSAAYETMRDIILEAGRQRGVDYTGGRRTHLWAKAAGFELVHVDAYHPHYITGEHKGFWNWTLHNAALTLVTEGSLSMTRLDDLVAGMTAADQSPDTLVAHCRMHQVIARKI
jgi:cyclopropane fatty-acyl-phospholipid synthase-like methyltransferase